MSTDDSICESSLPPNKSSGDIVERLRAAYEWICRPDWEEEFSLEDIVAWINKRPSGLLLESAAEIERLRRENAAHLKSYNLAIASRLEWRRQAETTNRRLLETHEAYEEMKARALTAESAVAAAIRSRASAIRSAVSKKTAESGHYPSTHNSESE